MVAWKARCVVRTNGVSEAYRYIFSNVPGHIVMEIGQVQVRSSRVSEVKSSE